MTVEATQSAEALLVRFIGELTIYQAADDHAALRAAWGEAGPVEVDLSEVTEIDSAGLQILLAMREQAQRQGRAFSIVALSAAVADVLHLLRLDAELGIAEALRLPSGSPVE